MKEIAAWIRERVPAERDLDRAELRELAEAVGREERLWRPSVRHDENVRYYTQLYRDPHLDIWLICWLNSQDTGYHDHDLSSGAVYVCEGTLVEDFLRREEDGWIRERTRDRPAGTSFDFDAASIHGMRHAGGPPVSSIHVYSPALWRMGHYEPGPTGLRRTSITYADELASSA
jgi:hypothetical protein